MGTGVTPEAYRPLLRVGRFLAIGCGTVAAAALTTEAYDLAIPMGGFGAIGLTWWLIASGFTAGYRTSQRHTVLSVPIAQPKRHGEVDRAAWANLPPAPLGQGRLYVIEFSSGTVKVGRTSEPAQRLHSHRRYAWAFGVVVVRAWISESHSGYEANEADLIGFAARSATGDRARREFFHGADFNALVKYATELASRSAVPAP